MSDKRRGERAQRLAVIAEVVARDGPHCSAVTLVPEVACWGPLDADERVARSQRPGGHLDPANVQMLCRRHHEWRHANPVEAARRGLRPYPKGYRGPDAPESGP